MSQSPDCFFTLTRFSIFLVFTPLFNHPVQSQFLIIFKTFFLDFSGRFHEEGARGGGATLFKCRMRLDWVG